MQLIESIWGKLSNFDRTTRLKDWIPREEAGCIFQVPGSDSQIAADARVNSASIPPLPEPGASTDRATAIKTAGSMQQPEVALPKLRVFSTLGV